jgi:hypothetical protein
MLLLKRDAFLEKSVQALAADVIGRGGSQRAMLPPRAQTNPPVHPNRRSIYPLPNRKCDTDSTIYNKVHSHQLSTSLARTAPRAPTTCTINTLKF